MKSLGLLCLLLAVTPLVAQDSYPNKRAVKFSCTCDDAVGQTYATAFRDLLALSPRYRETADSAETGADGKVTLYNWQIKVVSLDPSTGNTGQTTVISAVFLLGDVFYFNSMVQSCPRAQAASCASSTLAALDQLVNSK